MKICWCDGCRKEELNRLKGEIKKFQEEIKKLEEAKQDDKALIRLLTKRIRKLEKAVSELAERAQHYKNSAAKLWERTKRPPCGYAIFVRPHPGGKPDEVDVLDGGHLKKVALAIPGLIAKDLKCGWEVLLNAKDNVVEVTKNYWSWGSEVIFKEHLSEDIALVMSEMDSVQQCFLSQELKNVQLKSGDSLLNCGGLLVRVLPKTAEKDHDLEEIPDLDFSKVGGLSKQIAEIEEALAPFADREVYIKEAKGQDMPRGILLDGPPGCGKTLLARVIASNLAKHRGIKGYFMALTSTELINKYVGETERKLRELFNRAKEKSGDGNLVAIFIDEIDALIRSRDFAMDKEPWKGDTVAQFCGLLDGITPLGDIIVIGATNHKNLIDPAILRSGRMTVQITVPRPNRKGAEEILRIYLTPDLSFGQKYFQDDLYEYFDHFGSGKKEIAELNKNPEKVRDHFLDMVIKRIFYKGNPLEIVLGEGREDEEVLKIDNKIEVMNENQLLKTYLRDWISGDMLKNIVEKAKRIAFTRWIRKRKQDPGAKYELTKKDFFLAVDAEYQRIVSSVKAPRQVMEKQAPIGFIKNE